MSSGATCFIRRDDTYAPEHMSLRAELTAAEQGEGELRAALESLAEFCSLGGGEITDELAEKAARIAAEGNPQSPEHQRAWSRGYVRGLREPTSDLRRVSRHRMPIRQRTGRAPRSRRVVRSGASSRGDPPDPDSEPPLKPALRAYHAALRPTERRPR